MTDKEQSRENISIEPSSPKAYNKKEKTKYQAFRSDEDDSSELDEPDTSARVPRKLKKEHSSNTFKVKIKSIKGKKKAKEKEKKKKTKKSVTSGDEGNDPQDTPLHEPVFGVSLAVAVERSAFPDKIELPRIVRECILYVEEKGLDYEGIYRVSGVKSKVDNLKQLYNEGRKFDVNDYDPNTVASLLKLYLRELPSSVLTTRLAPIYDACVGLEDSNEQVKRFQQLLNDLPCPNRTLLAWLFTHFAHVMDRGSETKMNIQNLSIVFSPTMSISHGVLNIFFTHTKELFQNVELVKYIEPEDVEEDEQPFPDTIDGLQEVLRNNENVLAQLHEKVNQGGDQDEKLMDELWERQRRSTQIKRKIKGLKKEEKLKKSSSAVEPPVEPPVEPATEKGDDTVTPTPVVITKPKQPRKPKPKKETWKAEIIGTKSSREQIQDADVVDGSTVSSTAVELNDEVNQEIKSDEILESGDEEYQLMLLEEKRLLIENEEILKVSQIMKRKIQREQLEVERLNVSLREYQDIKEHQSSSSTSSSSRSSRSSLNEIEDSESEEDNTELELMLDDLEDENRKLQTQGTDLITKISAERNVCVQLRTDIRLLELKLATR